VGASTFYSPSRIKDPAAAYDDLVQAARFEDGNSPYSGTIATTQGFRVVSSTPVSSAQAYRIAGARIENLSKWGTCEVVAVGKAAKTRTRTVRLTVRPNEGDHYAQVNDADLAAALKVSVDHIESFKVLEMTPTYRQSTVKPGPARKVWATSRGGEFATRTEAVAFARKMLDMNRTVPVPSAITVRREVELFEKVIRSPQAAVVSQLVSLKAVVEVELAAAEREFDHWLFYGWVAS
jgi:hypothetical protein